MLKLGVRKARRHDSIERVTVRQHLKDADDRRSISRHSATTRTRSVRTNNSTQAASSGMIQLIVWVILRLEMVTE